MKEGSQIRWTSARVLALVLCLLAVTFSVEAKVAWYLPSHTVGCDLQFGKALPADVPQIIPHGMPDNYPLLPLLQVTLFSVFFAGYWRTACSLIRLIKHRSPTGSGFTCFSPENFFRPPPVL